MRARHRPGRGRGLGSAAARHYRTCGGRSWVAAGVGGGRATGTNSGNGAGSGGPIGGRGRRVRVRPICPSGWTRRLGERRTRRPWCSDPSGLYRRSFAACPSSRPGPPARACPRRHHGRRHGATAARTSKAVRCLGANGAAVNLGRGPTPWSIGGLVKARGGGADPGGRRSCRRSCTRSLLHSRPRLPGPGMYPATEKSRRSCEVRGARVSKASRSLQCTIPAVAGNHDLRAGLGFSEEGEIERRATRLEAGPGRKYPPTSGRSQARFVATTVSAKA